MAKRSFSRAGRVADGLLISFPLFRFAVLLLLLTTTFVWIFHLVQDLRPFSSRDLSPDEVYLLSQIKTFVNESANQPVLPLDPAEMGHRLRSLQGWVQLAESLDKRKDASNLSQQLWNQSERLAASHLPFLQHDSSSRPLHTTLHAHDPKTKGMVIPVGDTNFHLACHLISNIREVLNSKLPIQIAYSGDQDLSPDRKEFIIKSWTNIEMLDVLTRLDDQTIRLNTTGSSIKPFAALVSRFEQTILVETDAIFLQKPESVFEEPGYKETGVFLFKDRSVFAGNDRFHEDWWQMQFSDLEPMSDNFMRSRAYLEGFSEHGESGVVVLDKSRIEVQMALLHTCWQNTFDAREYTYMFANGDKESFWFGMEALATPYAMEKDYAAALGHECQEGNTHEKRICTTNIAHLDHKEQLLWYNGGLYHDKSANERVFSSIPNAWMVNGNWSTADPGSFSSMTGSQHHQLTTREYEIIFKTMKAAMSMDSSLKERNMIAPPSVAPAELSTESSTEPSPDSSSETPLEISASN